MKDYYKINKEAWNARTKIHLHSSFYDLDKFKKEVKSVPDLDLSLLGDIRGKSILHLQCHFGMDTLSLSKMGANVVGVDFSEEAIQTAKSLNEELGLNAQFCCCNIYDAPAVLQGQQFDIVYTSYGVVNWLPDLTQWGHVISQMLKDAGKFVIGNFTPYYGCSMKIFLKSDMLIRAKNLTLWKKQPTQIRKMTIGKRPLRGITGWL